MSYLLKDNINYVLRVFPSTPPSSFNTINFTSTTYPQRIMNDKIYQLKSLAFINGVFSATFFDTAEPLDSSKDVTLPVNVANFGTEPFAFRFFVDVDTTIDDQTKSYIDIVTCNITYTGSGVDALNNQTPSIDYGGHLVDDIDFDNISSPVTDQDYFKVTVTMNGVDVTEDVISFNNTPSSYQQYGDLDIAFVNGDVIVNIELVTAPRISMDSVLIQSDILGYYVYGTEVTITGNFIPTQPNRSIDFASYRITLDGIDVTSQYPIDSTIAVTGDIVIHLSLARNGTLNILDKNDNIITSIANRPLSLVTHISFTKSNNDYTLTLNQFYDDTMHIIGSITFTYANNLIGLGNIGEYNEIIVPVDTVDALFESNRFGGFNIHVIEEDASVVTDFSLTLYQNKSDDKVVYKDITPVGVATGVIRTVNGTNVLNLIVDIERSAIINFNYVYIPILKRYYYVTTYDIMNKDIYRLHLSVDVLMSYKDDIASQQVMVLRNEFEFDDTLNDNELPLTEIIEQEIVEIEHQDISILNQRSNYTNQTNCVLTILGGTD